MMTATSPSADTMDVPQGRFSLRLRHATPQSTLRAWDAADEYLLRELSIAALPRPLLVVGDRAGALTAALHGPDLVWAGDSATARLAMQANLRANGLDPDILAISMAQVFPDGAVAAVIKVPKSLERLDAQLHALRAVLPAGAPVIGAGMAKYLPPSVRESFGRIIGPTDQSLAWKKSRVLRSVVDPDLDPGPAPAPTTTQLETGEQIVGLPGVFGAGGVDGGTRMLVKHIPDDVADGLVVDLSCGTGVVGVVAMSRNPAATVHFCDDMAGAVESARRSVVATFGSTDRATFEMADGLVGVADDSAALVLLNPPFHDGHAISTDIAWRLVRDARRVLVPGGRLTVVGNRHLDHHTMMRRVFGNHDVVGSDRRFVVIQSRQPTS